MITILLTALFGISAVFAIASLSASLRRAFATHGVLRAQLAACPPTSSAARVTVTLWRVVEDASGGARVRPAPLSRVSARRSVRRPTLAAAA